MVMATKNHRKEWQDHIISVVKVLDMHIFNVNEDASHHIRQRDLLQQWLHNQKSWIKYNENRPTETTKTSSSG